MKVKCLMLVCLLVAVFMVVGCAPAKAPTPRAEIPSQYRGLRIVGSSLGSGVTTTATALSVVLEKYYPEISWSSSSGNTGTTVVYVSKGTLPLGMLSPGSYIDAYGFDKIPESRLRSINLPAGMASFIFLIPEDKPWKDISEVPKGLTFVAGPAGMLTTVAAEAWVKLAGLSKKDFNWINMGKTEMVDAWRAGKVDFACGMVSGSEAYLFDMQTSTRKIKAMGLSPQQVARAKAEQTFERLGLEPPSRTTLTKANPGMWKDEVYAAGYLVYLISRDDFPEEIAYKMARTIDEHRSELTAIYPAIIATPQWHMQWARPPLDIHSGVAKYYREKGYLK